MNKTDLHPYQQKSLEFLYKTKRAAIFLEMGLGKTVIALTLIDDLMDQGIVKKALVIAPKKLLKMTWLTEIEKWDHLFLQKMQIIEGAIQHRKKQFIRGAGLYGVSVDSIASYNELYDVPWDLVVIDESIKIKSRITRRWQGAKRLTSNPEARVVIMSGIPAPNSEMDLWAQYYILDRGERLGRSIETYRDRFFIHDYYTNKYRIRGGLKKKLSGCVKDVSLALNAADYLDMPDKIVTDVNIEMPDKYRAQYEKMQDEFVIELSKEVLEIMSAGAMLQKTMQYCNGFVYDELGAERIHNSKLDELQEIVENNAGENVIVTYVYREDLRALQERFPEARVVDEESVRLWNEGKVSMLLLHPQSAGYGLNLQKGGSIIIWYSLTWSYGDYEQTNARIYRQGQSKPVRIIRLITHDSVEQNIARALEDKRSANRTVMETLKAELAR